MIQMSQQENSNIPSILAELSADEPMPIAFSKARLWAHPRYAMFAEIRFSRKLGDYVLYSIAVLVGNGLYALDNPVYRSSCYEDIADVWSIFAKG